MTLQEIFQTVRLLPDPLPGVTVEITPMCDKYVICKMCCSFMCIHQIVITGAYKHYKAAQRNIKLMSLTVVKYHKP